MTESRGTVRRRQWDRIVAGLAALATGALLLGLTVGDRAAIPTPTSGPTSVPRAAASPTPGAPTDPAYGGFPWMTAAPASPSTGTWHVPVLMYHLVATPVEAGDARHGLVVPPALFAAQLAALRTAGWHTITAAALAADLRDGRRPAPLTFVITLDDGHGDGYAEALPILEASGFVATFYVITSRIGESGYLTADELRTMAAAGMEIADHTVDHVSLTALAGPAATAELEGAALAIDELLGAPPTTIAYPFGNVDATVVADAQALDFSMAFTTVEGCRESWASRFTTPRMRVNPSTTPADLVWQLRACR